jgi:hypothetical protein
MGSLLGQTQTRTRQREGEGHVYDPNPGACTQVAALMYQPATGDVVMATDGCEIDRLRSQGYTTDVPQGVANEYYGGRTDGSGSGDDSGNSDNSNNSAATAGVSTATLGLGAAAALTLYLSQ